MIIREITYNWSIACCHEDEGDVISWESEIFQDTIREEKVTFFNSLVMWRDSMIENIRKFIMINGEENCQHIVHYLHLCDYTINVIDINEIDLGFSIKKIKRLITARRM